MWWIVGGALWMVDGLYFTHTHRGIKNSFAKLSIT